MHCCSEKRKERGVGLFMGKIEFLALDLDSFSVVVLAKAHNPEYYSSASWRSRLFLFCSFLCACYDLFIHHFECTWQRKWRKGGMNLSNLRFHRRIPEMTFLYRECRYANVIAYYILVTCWKTYVIYLHFTTKIHHLLLVLRLCLLSPWWHFSDTSAE